MENNEAREAAWQAYGYFDVAESDEEYKRGRKLFDAGYDAGAASVQREWVPINSVDDLPEQKARCVWMDKNGNYDAFRFICPEDGKHWFIETYVAYMLIPPYTPKESV